MLQEIGVGTAVSLVNIAIHAVAMVVLVHAVRLRAVSRERDRTMVYLVVIMTTGVAVLMAAHFLEVAVWGGIYDFLGVAPDGVSDFSFAFVNYTTLGYGNVVPVPEWDLIGPITAMNGVLLFGWSTAVLFQLLSVSYHGLAEVR